MLSRPGDKFVHDGEHILQIHYSFFGGFFFILMMLSRLFGFSLTLIPMMWSLRNLSILTMTMHFWIQSLVKLTYKVVR